jgi:adenylate cyclase
VQSKFSAKCRPANAPISAQRRIDFRMGINVGDIIIEDGDIFGDGVNIAARMEALAEPGGICISGAAYEQVRDKLDFSFEDTGEQRVKNITRPVHVYRVDMQISRSLGGRQEEKATLPLPDRPSVAVLPFANMSSDPEQEFLANGIITALSHYPSLFVIAQNSCFTYKGAPSRFARSAAN